MASKSSLQKRLKQNKGVKHGTVRTGAGSKSTRKYNAKTGRWDVMSAKTGKGATTSTASKAASSAAARSRANAAAVRYKAMQAPKSSWGSARTSDAWRQQGGGGLAGKNSPLVGLDQRAVKSLKGAASSVPTASSSFKSASQGVANVKKKLPSSGRFKQGGGGLYGWLKSR
jgi:hypothetical protein